MPSVDEKVRLTLTVSPELNETLEELAARSHSTKSDVLRRAITLLEVAAEAKARDEKLGLFDKDRKLVTEIVGL
jgi:predicted transcriptional regulator